MSIIREEIFNEIIELLPEFRGKEQELKDIIDKLLQSQPDVKMDSDFKAKLREKIVEEASKKKKIIPFYKKMYFVIPGGVTAAAVLMFAVLLFNNPGVKGEAMSTLSPNEFSSVDSAPDDITSYTEADETSDLDQTSSREIIVEEFDGDGFNPEGPPGIEGQTPPTYNELSIDTNLKESSLNTEGSSNRGDVDDGMFGLIEQNEDTAEQPIVESRDLLRMRSEAEPSLGYMPEPEAEIMQQEEKMMLFEDEEIIVSTGDEFNTEEYSRIYENDFLTARNDPVSTFSIDVDTASYSNTRRHILNGYLPPADAVRIEELVNYFDYGYPEVEGEHPFDFNTALSTCPWNEDNLLLYVGVQGERKQFSELPPNNLVFLLDVSGSMSDANKLPLLKQSLQLLTKQLRPQDRVSIVVYAGAAGVVLPPTRGNDTETIISAFDVLEAGGSTAGGQGIELAYSLAEANFMRNGNNRIIIATDGDFNVGPSSTSETTRLIEEKRETGIFLTVLGFGMGNYKDSRMEQMADNGNGNYAYIDNIMEAKKVLVNEISSTLFTIASDVKIQIEFNPYYVEEYRLIGYENRVMANQDFDDDTKDAGELGAGHTVTAIYEIVRADSDSSTENDMRYQDNELNTTAATSGEIMTIKFRYKDPGNSESTLIEEPVLNSVTNFNRLDDSFRFAAAVAQWGMILRGSEYMGTSSYKSVLEIARDSDSYDPYGLKSEFINLVELSQYLE